MKHIRALLCSSLMVTCFVEKINPYYTNRINDKLPRKLTKFRVQVLLSSVYERCALDICFMKKMNPALT